MPCFVLPRPLAVKHKPAFGKQETSEPGWSKLSLPVPPPQAKEFDEKNPWYWVQETIICRLIVRFLRVDLFSVG